MITDEKTTQEKVRDYFEKFLQEWESPEIDSGVNLLDCIFAYRFLYGRNPGMDSELLHLFWLSETITLREFLTQIKDSEEFKNQTGIIPSGHFLMAELQDFKFWFNTSDSEMGVRMGFGIYEPETVQFFRNTIKSDWVCWDIGAQTGFFTCLFSTLVGHGGQVISYEPMPRSYELIRKNVIENGLEFRVVIKNVACSDAKGSIPMAQTSQMFVVDIESPNAMQIECVRLDEENNPLPNLIKIDVEGHEPAVIRGLAGILKHCSPILVMELNEYWLQRNSDTTGAEIIRSLNEMEYQVSLMESPEILINWREFRQGKLGNCNIVARRSSGCEI